MSIGAAASRCRTGSGDFLNNRHYQASTGVFTSVDPMVSKTGQPYLYGAANPVRFSDPSGLDPDTASWVRSGAERGGGCTYSSGKDCYTRKYVTAKNPKKWAKQYDIAVAKYERASLGYGSSRSRIGVPEWTPTEVIPAATSSDGLRSELNFLDDVLTRDLEDFRAIWSMADTWPQYDWTNDGCSDKNVVTAGNFGCIRHDFLYRNQKMLDSRFASDGIFVDGMLRENNGVFRDLADQALAEDVGGLRAMAVDLGVHYAGTGFYSAWNEQVWQQRTVDSIYGNESGNVRPTGQQPGWIGGNITDYRFFQI